MTPTANKTEIVKAGSEGFRLLFSMAIGTLKFQKLTISIALPE